MIRWSDYNAEVKPPASHPAIEQGRSGPCGVVNLPEWDEAKHDGPYDRYYNGESVTDEERAMVVALDAALDAAQKTVWTVKLDDITSSITFPKTDEWLDWVELCLEKAYDHDRDLDIEVGEVGITIRQIVSDEDKAAADADAKAAFAASQMPDSGSGYGMNTSD